MKKKSEFYICAIMAVICFAMTGALPCVAAEDLSGTVESIIADSAVLDTGDADSVRQMVDDLENMRQECLAEISSEENVEGGEESLSVPDKLQIGEWITLDRAVCVRVPADERNMSYVYVMMIPETDASVIWETTILPGTETTDIFENFWYLSKGQLLGFQSGMKDDRINFVGILPHWIEEQRRETVPLSGNGYVSESGYVYNYSAESDAAMYYQDRAVSILNPGVPGPLESVDIRLEEMADQTNTEDASSVASYIRELSRMQYLMSMERFESVAEKDLKERIIDLPINSEGGASGWKTEDGRGGMMRIYGGDSYSEYFIFDGELIGVQTGNSVGEITFASQLPQWKDDDTSMDVPLVGEGSIQGYPDNKISREDVMQSYGDIIADIWP